jgi:hypothetical protein
LYATRSRFEAASSLERTDLGLKAETEMSDPESGNRNFDAWAAEIRQQESSDNYGSDTGTHLGAYQMGSAALLAAGFQDKAGRWTG